MKLISLSILAVTILVLIVGCGETPISNNTASSPQTAEDCAENELWFAQDCEGEATCIEKAFNPPTKSCFEPIPASCSHSSDPDGWCQMLLGDAEAGCGLEDGFPNENGCVGQGTDPCQEIDCQDNYECNPFSQECERLPVPCETWADCEQAEFREPTDDICSTQGYCTRASHCRESVGPLAYCSRRLGLPQDQVDCDENNDGVMGACVEQ